jgi:GT2 family glycosyltransferase
VTYNNPGMLGDVLRDLGRQHMRLHQIIVVDNSSAPATRVMVRQHYPSATYVAMPDNVGTAGGFHEGIRRAVPHCDFVLTLDDDVRMQPDSVAALYRGFQHLKGRTPRLGAVRAVGAQHGRSVPCKLDDFAWRGTLISAAAIRRVGLPMPQYFMYADDVEFSMQLARQGYEVFDIPGSKIMEQRTWDKMSQRVLGRTVRCYAEDFRFYYALRNSIHAYKTHGRHRALVRTLAYAVKLVVFFGVFHRWRRRHTLQAIVRGVIDGLRSHLGKNCRYLPPGAQWPVAACEDSA